MTSADEESWWIVKTRVMCEGGGGTPCPMPTCTNYKHWALLMQVMLEGCWEAIKIGTTIQSDDRLAPKVVHDGISLEIMTILTTKPTAKDTWDTLRTIGLGVAHVYETTLATLSKHYSDIRFTNCDMVETLPFASRA